MNKYPIGGGIVGTANQAMGGVPEAPGMGQSMISPELAQALMKKMQTPPTADPVQTKGGMQSALGGGAGGGGWASAFKKFTGML